MKIVFSNRKDNFIEKYDYGTDIISLDEYVIRTISSCPLECLYCYLQDVYCDKKVILYNNTDKLKKEILYLRKNINGIIYLNNGENADSLLFEPRFGMNRFLIEVVQKLHSTYLELRTKTANVDHLLKLNHCDRVIIAFSLNPHEYIAKYEPNTSLLKQRLRAISKCQKAGYMIGLRFEPILHLKNWQREYYELVKTASEWVDINKIHSIGIGTLRLTRGLYKKLRKKYGMIDFLNDEFVPCSDNKLRYFRKIRVEIYRTLIDILCQFFSRLTVCENFFLPQNDYKIPVFISNEPEYIWSDCLKV